MNGLLEILQLSVDVVEVILGLHANMVSIWGVCVDLVRVREQVSLRSR